MDLAEVLLIALGLSMDALAVSIANGLGSKKLRINHALMMATSFGAFQAFMPLIGWAAGLSLSSLISGIDHWLAFALLSVIGCKMIYESFKIGDAEKRSNPLNLYMLLILSVATSIDALVVGLSFAFLEISIATSVMAIGAITFLISFLGASLAGKFKGLVENKVEIVGGLILIIIGLKILLEHVV